jgi:hypothetical protein
MWLDEGEGVGNTGVASGFLVVKSVGHPPPKTVVFHDNKGRAFPKVIVVVDAEVMGIVPVFEEGIVFFLVEFGTIVKVVVGGGGAVDRGAAGPEVGVWGEALKEPWGHAFKAIKGEYDEMVVGVREGLVVRTAAEGICFVHFAGFVP